MKLGNHIETAEYKFIRHISERLVNFIVFLIGVILAIVGVIIKDNPNLTTIFYGVGGSLIASAVVSYLTSLYIYKRNKEKELTDYWGIYEIFETRQKMNISCNTYLGKMVDFLDIASFGMKSFRDSQSSLIEEKVKQGVKIRILTLPLDFYFRIDNHLFIGPYLYGKGSQQTISYEFQSESKGFDYYTNYYNDLWEDEYFPKKSY